VLHHRHEDRGFRKKLADAGCGVGIGGRGVVAGKSLFLRADHALRGGDIVGRASRACKAKESGEQQDCEDGGAHTRHSQVHRHQA
jgi:hypothetical protein